MEVPKTRIGGIPFPHVDLEGAVEALLSGPGLHAGVPWRFVNAYSLALTLRDRSYAAVLRGEGLNLADGRPVAALLRRLSLRRGCPTTPGHVRGPSFFRLVLQRGCDSNLRHFLLGSTPETLAALQRAILRQYPDARVVGVESPPFRPLTEAEQVEQDARIAATRPDLVWVGLGTPRQDVEAARLARSLGRPALAVGAAFDFVAGTRTEAPVWVQRLALEWAYRFVVEPRRLWRRYTIELGRFAVMAARELGQWAQTQPVAWWRELESMPAWWRAGIPDRRRAGQDRRRAQPPGPGGNGQGERRRADRPDRRRADQTLPVPAGREISDRAV